MVLQLRDLVHAPLMPAALERGREPHRGDFIGQAERHDASPHREDVRVVVLARHARRIEIVTERRTHAPYLVGRDLFALTAATEDDSTLDLAFGDGASDLGADRRVIDWLIGERSAIVDLVAEARQGGHEVLFQRETCVVRADRDAHKRDYKGDQRATSAWSETDMVDVTVNRRGEERIRLGHLWVYRSDVIDAAAEPGATVRVIGARSRVLGYALYSSRSEIALRFFARGDTAPDLDTWRSRIQQAVAYRNTLAIDATAFRLIHGEADLMPSLIVDRYADYLVVQTLSQGTDRLLPDITKLLVETLQPSGILARNDPKVRTLEGLEQRIDVVHGSVPEAICVRDGPIVYSVDPYQGQKTGLFLDQRENRLAAARYARGRLLDAFSYHGGFALTLAAACEEVLAIDISEDAVARIRENAARNGITNIEARAMNVFDELRELERRGERFDTIVLDPPAFAKSRAALPKALTGYKEINLRALKILRPGGFLITCTCSYNVSEADFAEVLAAAAIDAHADVAVVEKRMQARDHPVLMTVPETYYLKCFILRRL